MKFPYASVASDETGATAAIFWVYAPEPPRLTLIDVEVSTVADLSAFLPHLNGRLYELAHEMMPAAAQAASPYGRFLNSLNQPPPFVPSIFAPATLGQMLGLLSIAHVEIPELIGPQGRDVHLGRDGSAFARSRREDRKPPVQRDRLSPGGAGPLRSRRGLRPGRAGWHLRPRLV